MSYQLPRTPIQKAMAIADAARLRMIGGSLNDIVDDSPGLALLRHKSAVNPVTIGDNGPLVSLHSAESEFIASLSNYFLGLIAASAVKLSHALAPAGVTTFGGHGGAHVEGQTKRVTQFGFDAITLAHCVGFGLTVISRDLAKIAPLAVSLIARELRNVVGLEDDKAAIAVLLDSIVPLFPSGTDALAFIADLLRLLTQVSGGAGSVYVLAMNPGLLKTVSMFATPDGELLFQTLTANGGELQGIIVVPCDALEADSSGSDMVLVDATQIGYCDIAVEIRNAQHATLQMDGAPDSPPTASTIATSLWQNNLTASLVEHHFGIARLRDTAVAYMTGCNYGAA